MSEVNNPEVELTEDQVLNDVPDNFLGDVFDENFAEEERDIVETDDELKDSDTPDEPEDESTDDDNDDQADDDSEDETEDDLDDDSEEETDEEIWDINDLESTQVIRLADGTETNIQGLIDGQMMQSDYTKKTTALAEERRVLQEEKASVAQQSKRLMTNDQSVVEAWQEELMDAEDQFRRSPTSQEAKQRYDVAQVTLKAAQRQHQETEDVHTQNMQDINNRRIQEADIYAGEHIEGWSQDMAGELLDYVRESSGASNEEILELVSGPMLVIVADAMKQTKGAKIASTKRTTAKKTGKSLKKNSSKARKTSKSSKKAKSDQVAIDKYAESGDFDDLNSIFPENFMGQFDE